MDFSHENFKFLIAVAAEFGSLPNFVHIDRVGEQLRICHQHTSDCFNRKSNRFIIDLPFFKIFSMLLIFYSSNDEVMKVIVDIYFSALSAFIQIEGSNPLVDGFCRIRFG